MMESNSKHANKRRRAAEKRARKHARREAREREAARGITRAKDRRVEVPLARAPFLAPASVRSAAPHRPALDARQLALWLPGEDVDALLAPPAAHSWQAEAEALAAYAAKVSKFDRSYWDRLTDCIGPAFPHHTAFLERATKP